MRVHITGGSGSGVTTLGAHLALAIEAPHADTDDYFWLPTDPPFHQKRPVKDRLDLMHAAFIPREKWVLSGSLIGWGDPLIPAFNLVVCLHVAPDVRLARLHWRQAITYGDRIKSGGDMEATHREFMAWAARYDDPMFIGRSAVQHQVWCDALPCHVLKLDSDQPVGELVAFCLQELSQ